MTKDARLLLNKKRWKNQSGNRTTEQQRGITKPTVDARMILNSKRAKQIPSSNRLIQGNRIKINNSAKGLFTKSFLAAKKKDKQIEVTNDGNILITSKSKETQTRPSSFKRESLSTTLKVQKPQWVPADVDMDNIEHIGLNDLLDIESLPQTPANIPFQSKLSASRMLPGGISGLQDTMVADQISYASTPLLATKVIVTNLHASVTKQDILDLFGVIGIVKAIHMNQPGTAFVEFLNTMDATRACSIYNNRLLDGQLMKCFVEKNATPQRASVSHRLGSRIQPASPISSFVPNPRSRYNPHDVQFMVKLN